MAYYSLAWYRCSLCLHRWRLSHLEFPAECPMCHKEEGVELFSTATTKVVETEWVN